MNEFRVTKKTVNFIQYRIVLASYELNPFFRDKPQCKLIAFIAIDELFKDKGWKLNKITFYDEYMDIVGTFDSEYPPKRVVQSIRKCTTNAFRGQLESLAVNQPIPSEKIDGFYRRVHHSNLTERDDLNVNYQKELAGRIWSAYSLITTDINIPHSRILSWLIGQGKIKPIEGVY